MNILQSMCTVAVVCLLTVSALLTGGCGQQVQAVAGNDSVIVYCGGGVRGPVSECADRFTEKTGIRIQAVFGSSRSMMQRACTEHGDMYIAGDIKYIDAAQKKGYLRSRRNVCSVIPVITVKTGNPKGIRNLKDLGRPGVRFFLVDAARCQMGIHGEALLAAQGIGPDVLKANRISVLPEGKTIASMLESAEIDAALIWEHGARRMKSFVSILNIPDLKKAACPVAGVVFSTGRSRVAEQFLDFLCSSECAKVFVTFGFSTVSALSAEEGVLQYPDYTVFSSEKANKFNRVAQQRPIVYSRLAAYLARRFDLSRRPGIGIDIGSGPGDLIAELAARTEQFYWINADINTWYMKHFAQRMKDKGVSHRTAFIFADACSLPFKDGYADLVVSRGCYQFWPDLEQGLCEVLRVLRQGGEAFIGRGFPPDMPEEEVRELFSRKIVGGPKYDPDADAGRFRGIMKKLGIHTYEVIRHISPDRKLNYGVWLHIRKE